MAKIKGNKRAEGDALPAKRKSTNARDALAAYGEGFMAMFDDSEESSRTATRHGKRKALGASEADATADNSASKREMKDHLNGHRQLLMPNQKERQNSPGGNPSDGRRVPGAARKKEGRDVMSDIFGRAGVGGSGGGRNASGSLGGRSASDNGGAGVVTFVDPMRRSAADKLAEKERMAMERRQFMSCKVSKVHQAAAVGTTGMADESERQQDDLLSPEAFQQMQREAEELGAAALDKKGKKAFRARQLLAIGAKLEKAPRVAAMIGKGMAKKQAMRSARALEEAIESGMVQQKGLGKKKQREKAAAAAKSRKPGLGDPLGSKFKNGTLHVGHVGARRKKGGSRKQSVLKGIKL